MTRAGVAKIAVWVGLVVAGSCWADEPRGVDFGYAVGIGIYDAGFPNLAPSAEWTLGYRIDPRFGIGAYVAGLAGIANRYDANFRGAQLHYGAEGRYFPGASDRWMLALQLGLVGYDVAPDAAQGASSRTALDASLKAAYEIPIDTWVSVIGELASAIPTQSGEFGSFRLLGGVRLYLRPEATPEDR